MVMHDLFDYKELEQLNDRQLGALNARLTRELLTNTDVRAALQKQADHISRNIIKK